MATMRARVELKGSLTHRAPAGKGGRTMKKGSPVIITEPAHIQYYKSQADFSVTVLDAMKSAAKPADGDNEGDGLPTQADLKKKKKAELQDIADGLGLETDGASVAELIDGILEEQSAE